MIRIAHTTKTQGKDWGLVKDFALRALYLGTKPKDGAPDPFPNITPREHLNDMRAMFNSSK